MVDQKELTPISFHGDTIYAVDHNGEPYTAMRPIIENMGLTWPSQLTKLQNQAARWGVTIIVTPSEGGPQQTLCIPVRKLAGFLATINHNKVKNQLRAKVLAYQRECDDVLWAYWSGGADRADGRDDFESGWGDCWEDDFDAIDYGDVSSNQRIRLLSLSIKFASLSPAERQRAMAYYDNFCKQATKDGNGKHNSSRASWVSDHVRRFLADRCEVGSDCQVTKSNLYDVYREFCRQENVSPLSKTIFFKNIYALTEARPVRFRHSLAKQRIWAVVGIGLN